MSIVLKMSQEPTRAPPSMVQFINPSIREEHQKSIPSKEERKELLNSMSFRCSYVNCGKIMGRSDAKTCSRCKQVSFAKVASDGTSH